MTDKPLLFLDVDGPLNPWRAKATQRPPGYKTVRTRPDGTMWADTKVAPLRVWLNESHGPNLLALPYELVWATTWGEQANVWIGPHIGLPELPVVDFKNGAKANYRGRTHWKTSYLISYAAGRPFVWVDDECTEADQKHFNAKADCRGKIYWVDPSTGLTVNDFRTLVDRASEV